MIVESNDTHLRLRVDTETPDELAGYKTFDELIEVCVPNLTKTSHPDTNAPIYSYDGRVWWIPDYLTNDPLEQIRDNNEILLESV